jgi:signal transduction histidine kinase
VRLKARLVLIISLPAVLAVSAHGVLRVRQEEAQVRREERQALGLTAAAVQIAVENALRDRQLADVKRLLSQIVEEQESVDRVRLFDRSLASTVVSGPWTFGDPVPTEVLQRVIRTGLGEGDYERRGTTSYLSYIVPVRGRSGSIEGALEIVQLAAAIDRRLREALIDILVRLGLLAALIIIPTGVALQRQVIRPLSRLTEGIRALGRGRSGPPLPVHRGDEIGQVAHAFNDMAQRLGAETAHSMDLENRLRRTATLAVAGKLTASLAHEVGTPLNIISGRAEFMLKSMSADDPRREDVEGIVAQIERISRIITSLLDGVRPQALQLEAIHLATLVDQLFPLLQHTVRQRNVALAREVAGSMRPIQADPAQLQQVLINLVLNALDATPPGGRITIRAAESSRGERDGVAISVADTGTGIAPALLPRIFDPFLTTKPRGSGTGLGLAICRDIVRAHGGEISVESAVGAGSTFAVWLPWVPVPHD